MRYTLNISEEEKQALLAQHQQPYNGYQTLQLQKPSNRITVYDPAGDKHGVQVTANGGVRTYSNVNLREGKGEMCECGGMMYEGECMECGYKMEGAAKLQDKFDYVEEGEMCNECGSGMMREGECNECGYTIKNPEPMYSQGFEYNESTEFVGPIIGKKSEVGEEVSASLQQPYSDIDFGSYDFDSKGPEQFGDEDTDVETMLQDLELSTDVYKNKKKPYDFDSDGPLATSGVFEDIDDVEEIEKVKESIQESLNWFKRFSKYN